MDEQIALPLLSEILVAPLLPKYDRRLSDKILAAFAHAYEVGERAIALSLRRILEEAEGNMRASPAERRNSFNALRQAELLVEFVDAKDLYKRASQRTPPDAEEMDRASQEMLEAYRRWSDS